MRLTQVAENSQIFSNGFQEFNKKQIVELFKQGKDLEIYDVNDIEITREYLVTIAFGVQTNNHLIDYISLTIDDEDLEDIIMCGGYENWKLRRVLGGFNRDS